MRGDIYLDDDGEESKKSLRHLELIDSPVTEFGVRKAFVY